MDGLLRQPQIRGAQRWLVRSAERFGFDEIRAYHPRDLQRTAFFRQHREILKLSRGAGYWLWKPYYILQTLRETAPGDIVAYIDSGIEIIADLKPVLDICTGGSGITLFQVHDGYNIIWTKRSCMAGMNCDEPRYHQAQQVVGGFQLYRHCPETFEFLTTWLDYCCQAQLLTDAPDPPGMESYPEFKDHRHDQSILSLMATRRVCRFTVAPHSMGILGRCVSFVHQERRNIPRDYRTGIRRTGNFSIIIGVIEQRGVGIATKAFGKRSCRCAN